jgi:multidrug efflux system outer membrane protein
VTRQRLSEKRTEEARAVASYEEAVKLATQRYTAGRASYFEVLQAQQLLFPAQVVLAQARRDEFIAVVQLYKALGGGWNREGSGPAAPGAGS